MTARQSIHIDEETRGFASTLAHCVDELAQGACGDRRDRAERGDLLFRALQSCQLIVKPRARVTDLVAHVVDALWPQFQPITDLFGT